MKLDKTLENAIKGVTLDEVIEAVGDFRSGAKRRLDYESYGSDLRQFYVGKVGAYDDVLSWLKAKKEGQV